MKLKIIHQFMNPAPSLTTLQKESSTLFPLLLSKLILILTSLSAYLPEAQDSHLTLKNYTIKTEHCYKFMNTILVYFFYLHA